MAHEAHYIHPDLKISGFTEHFQKSDVLFESHLLVWFISGETKIIQGGQAHIFGAGDTLFFPRHELVTVINYPKNGLPHRSVVMHLTAPRLEAYYAKNKVDVKPVPRPGFRTFEKHPLLQSCMASLVPYFDLREALPEALAGMKIEEAITILRTIEPEIDHFLADFGEPGKINLVDFMEQHFMYNLPMTKFGYLTGRSLTTFKRDFKKTYQTTPQKWLTEKRLALAHYLIREKKRRPSEVYLEVGFENLSHFGYAFKKHFGYAPTD
ncbi:helix-turn-helix domain-containing protein [Dyadobacter fermentans]|uniref:Transcriptional regulator, AraC family n=1 Tax=Dyadobacter fermentans (strain ATCC 700827 / DSM 18053 / CIP 107007 / KCTC 52180 / NS114) TaxID=471854 RepID=C6VRQ7_DYAFD|nr:AraC family transcriptional regulator [Dyadobacter fermentans]ACT92760.1 transcriptional regulator, AraC family [Dyadobacter fermentans DSM 18053]